MHNTSSETLVLQVEIALAGDPRLAAPTWLPRSREKTGVSRGQEQIPVHRIGSDCEVLGSTGLWLVGKSLTGLVTMTDASIDAEIGRIFNLPIKELRAEWHRWYPERQLPQRLSRDLLVRTIAWRLQEQRVGGASAKLMRELDRLADQLHRSGTLDIEREATIKPGTRLVREWHGETHRVTALDDGYLYGGRHFISLSEIARAITGTRWSGPRFFGLKPARPKSKLVSVVDE